MRVFAAVLTSTLLAACATTPAPEVESEADASALATAGYQANAVAGESTNLCQPRIVNGRAVLDDNCLNIIERSPSGGRQIHAIGRETKQLRSLCENLVLPKCRRKY